MSSEQELRDLFAASASPPHSIDTRRVITASRGRRRPLQIATGLAGALAIVGIVAVGVQASSLLSPGATMSQGAAEGVSTAERAPQGQGLDSTIKRAPAEKLYLCTGTLAEVAPSTYGLVVDVIFPPRALISAGTVNGTVRLTNTGDAPVLGYTNPNPAITLSQDGVVLWHSNGPTIMPLATVNLEPGASMEYQASFAPVRCDVGDDLAESFRDGLPPVAAGVFDLSAALDFTPDASMPRPGTPELDLVTGPLSQIALD